MEYDFYHVDPLIMQYAVVIPHSQNSDQWNIDGGTYFINSPHMDQGNKIMSVGAVIQQ